MIRSNLYTFIHCACFLLVSVGVTAGNLTKPESASDTFCCEPLLLHFRFDRSLVEYDYMDNPHTLAAFSTLFADSLSTAQIDTVTITSYASPEGDTQYKRISSLEIPASRPVPHPYPAAGRRLDRASPINRSGHIRPRPGGCVGYFGQSIRHIAL